MPIIYQKFPLICQMQEAAVPLKLWMQYKAVRGIAWLYNQSGQFEYAAIHKYAQKEKLRKIYEIGQAKAQLCFILQDHSG